MILEGHLNIKYVMPMCAGFVRPPMLKERNTKSLTSRS